MKRIIRATALLMTFLLMLTGLAALPVSAAEDTVYLGDREDLFLGRDSLDGFGWNTAHSGERITIGSQSFDKGLGFHCLPDKDAYCEFDTISTTPTENGMCSCAKRSISDKYSSWVYA